ncbi:Kelch repeat type 1,Kelch-type beta propeller,Kelch repeat type 2 [Cinara cedri]|uniref:Kelch repeat type 1,Kelch-type beta propeller,Kelch repeat type 2 n=1 Tax=Cinara cedri TaxID=506608 RepID=A0A5E4NCZ7_9HEMI|nr:Kelch repeat type 1,Kelch-type beta propeller,Kelch repeat type 2 [Cinara cedri]
MYWTVHLYGGPRRVNHAAIAIGTTIFTFGGYCSGVDYKTFKPIDIHILDTVKFKWWVLNNNDQDSTCIPFQRYGHTAVTLGSKVYLWGGRNDKEVCNTLYCFDTETLKWSTPNVYGTIPMPRDGHSACVIKNQMFIFGGFQENPTQFSQDLYMLDFHTMAWSIVKTNGDPPSHRDFHTATAIGNKMYIFGGRGDNDESRVSGKEVYCPNIYYFDTLTKMWVCPVVYGDKPNGRRSHSAFVHNGFMYIFGGFNRNLDLHYKDIHRYDPIKSTWLKMNPKGTSPCARRRQICLVVNDQVFISGGTSPNYPKTQLQNFRVLNYDFSSHILNQLKDHDDLHVLNLNPSLKDMLLVNVWELLDSQGISPLHLCIPTSLKNDLASVNPSEITEIGSNVMSMDQLD